MDFGGSSSLLRFDNVSLDPRTEIITTASIRDRVENRNGSDSKHCLTGPGTGSGCSFWSYSFGCDWMEFGMLPHVSTIAGHDGNSPGEPGYWQAASLEMLTQSYDLLFSFMADDVW